MDSLWQYQPRSLKLGQIYTSTSLLASFHGYGSPPIDIGQPYALPPNLIRRHSRTVVVNERCFEIWSPNSKQDPYFPGPLAQVDEWGSSLRPVSEGRWDGQLGPCDPTISPQYYNSWEPWQAFIARKLPDLYSTTDDPDITFRPVYDVWCTTCDSYTGKIDPTYIQTLKARHEALDQQIHQRKQLQSGRLRRDMQNASTFFPLSDLEELKRITRYADAVVKVRRLQRLLLKKQAWVDMARAWDQSGNLTIETLRSRSPIPADESRMGLWMNGSSISEHDFLWLLTQTDVPCFFIEESTTLPCHALRSFVAGTPIQGLMASCLYDELARNAGGDVVEVVCPEPPIETKSPPTQNPGTVYHSTNLQLSVTPGIDIDLDKVILVYPVSVTWRDWNRLEPDQYLNDSIMELGIQLWLMDLKKKDPNLVDQVHIFNTFFFKLLSENGYQQVRKWTSKFDLFSKKYILVPINNPSRNHWYMALIYKPEYMVKSLPPVVETIIDVDALPDIEPRTYIFSLDSLGGANFWALEILSDYLKHEARDKLSKPLAGGPIPILRKARVPIQPNNYDCGLYALHVMQVFLGDPESFCIHIIGPNSAERWGEPIGLRSILRDRIGQLALEQAKQPPKVVSYDSEDDIEVVDTPIAKIDSQRNSLGLGEAGEQDGRREMDSTDARTLHIPAVCTDLGLRSEANGKQTAYESLPSLISGFYDVGASELKDEADETLQLFDLPSSHEALERSAGLPPSLLQKAEQVRLEDGPAEIEPSIADVHRLAQQDTNILDDEATDVLDNKTPEDEARHLNAMSEAVDGSASAQSSDFSTTATEVSPGVVENMDDPLTARPAKRPGAANNVLAAPPVKRLRLQVIYPVPAGTVPAERPADAPPRATSSSRKRGARSGRSKRSKELDLTLHRGMKEAGTFSGWQALQQLSLREVPPLDSESRNTQLY